MTEEIIKFNKSDVESLEEAIKRLEFELKVTKADYEASEQENKELKEKIIKLSEEKGHLIVENNTLKEKNEGLKIKHQRYRECSMQLNKKYKSVLEEIREIAEPRFVNGLNEEADQYNQCMDRIQDKINEVLQ